MHLSVCVERKQAIRAHPMGRLASWPGDPRLYRLQSPLIGEGGLVDHVLVMAGELKTDDGRRVPLAVVWPASEQGAVVARALATIRVPDHERALRRAGIEPMATETEGATELLARLGGDRTGGAA